jgi:branched-chain amino acid transport system permease protein
VINRETGTFKRTYAEDMALYRLPLARWAVAAIAVIAYVIFPAFATPYMLNLANLIAIACLGAIGLNILVGMSGQISVGHAGFMSVGAYTSAALSVKFGVPWWLAMPAGGAMAAAFGVVIGTPSLRIKGLYLAIATLAAQLIIEWGINHWTWLSGGASASIYVQKPSLFGYELKSNRDMYWFILVTLTIGIVYALNLTRTHLGRAFIAVRDRDIAAEIIGVNIFRTRLTAFAVSSFYAGITGVIYTYYYGIANYEAFTLTISIQFLAMIIIGGLGSVLGSILGAIFISLVPTLIDLGLVHIGMGWFGLEGGQIASVTSSLQLILFGGLIMFFLVVEPDGLNKLWNNIKDYFRVWPFPYM